MTTRTSGDAMTSEATRHVMQANKSKNTSPELKVRAALRAAGLTGYRLHWKKAPGRPDVCFPGRKVAIFVNGCFWHRCPRCELSLPKSHARFWEEKFERNVARDARDNALLVTGGWTVVVVWECQLRRDLLESTMHDVILEIDRAGAGGPRVARVVEIGALPAWRLRLAQRRLRRGSGHRRRA